ncbi:hypothetical protein F5Y04DRAFT_283620 [Hypomontagnella monticulosa]|nr:hypothetical protein F5Y04DRAFT_283620 [Hypomontagnella monticulosa]
MPVGGGRGGGGGLDSIDTGESNSSDGTSDSPGSIAGIVVGTIAGVVILSVSIYFYTMRRRRELSQSKTDVGQRAQDGQARVPYRNRRYPDEIPPRQTGNY